MQWVSVGRGEGRDSQEIGRRRMEMQRWQMRWLKEVVGGLAAAGQGMVKGGEVRDAVGLEDAGRTRKSLGCEWALTTVPVMGRNGPEQCALQGIIFAIHDLRVIEKLRIAFPNVCDNRLPTAVPAFV